MNHSAENSQSDFIRSLTNLLAIIAAFAINVYSNLKPVNDLTIGEISNQFFDDILIIPANYAFAIWGLIYLGLVSFGIYQFLPQQRNNAYLRRCSYFIVAASLAQIAWVFIFQYQWFVLSLVAMIGILGSLIAMYLNLNIARERVLQKQKWLVHYPLSIYLAWISVATIVNVAIALYAAGWNGGGISPEIWTILMLIVATAIAILMRLQREDLPFLGVFIWAFVAIAIRAGGQGAVAIAAGSLALVLAAVGFVRPSR